MGSSMAARIGECPVPGCAVFEGDLFASDVLADSVSTFSQIRDLGDLVWLPRYRMFAAGRYLDVQKALRASDVLISGRGVSVNAAQRSDAPRRDPAGVLVMDGEEHATCKRLLMKPLTPGALQAIRDRLTAEADGIVRSAATGREFDAMQVLASHLPTRIVSEMVGLTGVGADRMLRWSVAAFDGFAPPDHPRVLSALPDIRDFIGYARALTKEMVVPGGWAATLFQAVERDEISIDTARKLVFDYTTPSLDTTILATGEMLWQLATVDGAFDAVRANPDLIPSIVYEAVRLAAPIRGFARYARVDFAFSEHVLPARSWIYLMNAAANRDERHYPDPDRFLVTRNPRDQLAWGYGAHLCAGMHLARLEMEVLLGALVRSVRSIEAGTPTRLINTGVQGYRHLPLTLRPL